MVGCDRNSRRQPELERHDQVPDPGRCDYLFVHVGDGRRWLIPTRELECRTALTLGGPKYSEFEIDAGQPLRSARLNPPSVRGSAGAGEPGQPVKLVP